MRVLNYMLIAGQELPIAAVGDTVSFISGTGAIEVQTDAGQGKAYLEPGDSIKLTRSEFANITIRDVSGAANAVKVLVGFVEYVTAKLTGSVAVSSIAGTVTTSNPDHASANGLHFMGSQNIGSSTGQYPCTQLWNPATSGVNLACNSMLVTSAAAGDVYLAGYATEMADQFPLTANKNIGSAQAPNGVIRGDVPTVLVGNKLARIPVLGATEREIISAGSITIPPGIGLVLIGVQQSSAKVILDWEEYTP